MGAGNSAFAPAKGFNTINDHLYIPSSFFYGGMGTTPVEDETMVIVNQVEESRS